MKIDGSKVLYNSIQVWYHFKTTGNKFHRGLFLRTLMMLRLWIFDFFVFERWTNLKFSDMEYDSWELPNLELKFFCRNFYLRFSRLKIWTSRSWVIWSKKGTRRRPKDQQTNALEKCMVPYCSVVLLKRLWRTETSTA